MLQTEEQVEEIESKQVIECPFGKIPVEAKDILFFPEGLYGYDQAHRYLVWEVKEYLPFRWLICLEDPELMFPVVDPRIVHPDYNPKIDGLEYEGEMMAVVTMGRTVESVTVNLRAPIVISRGQNRAKQVILTDSHYPLRYRVLKS